MLTLNQVSNFQPETTDSYLVQFDCPFGDINLLNGFMPIDTIQYDNIDVRTKTFTVNKWEIEVPTLSIPFPKTISIGVYDNDKREIITTIQDFYNNHEALLKGRIPFNDKKFLSRVYIRRFAQNAELVSTEAYKFYVKSAGSTLLNNKMEAGLYTLEMVILGRV